MNPVLPVSLLLPILFVLLIALQIYRASKAFKRAQNSGTRAGGTKAKMVPEELRSAMEKYVEEARRRRRASTGQSRESAQEADQSDDEVGVSEKFPDLTRNSPQFGERAPSRYRLPEDQPLKAESAFFPSLLLLALLVCVALLVYRHLAG